MRTCPKCGTVLKSGGRFCPKCGSSIENEIEKINQPKRSDKSRIVTGLLNIGLPGIGRFYAGYNDIGKKQLLTSLIFVGFVWSIVDGINIIMTKDFPDGEGNPMYD